MSSPPPFFVVTFAFNLGHLELYMKDTDNSVEARRRLREIESKCEIELQGSTTLRDLHILVSIPKKSMKHVYIYFFRGVRLSILTGLRGASSSG